MIGIFGDIVFEVSADKILNFDGFTRETASTYENHALIGQKPRTEFVAPGLDTITFTVLLKAQHGVKPRDEMNKWVGYCRSGEAFPLMIGESALGVDKWVVTSVSQQWDTIYNQGELVAGKVDVSLQEYVSTMWTPPGYSGGTKILANNINELATVDSGRYNRNQYGKSALGQSCYFDPATGEFVYLLNAMENIANSARDFIANNSYCIEPREQG